MAQVYANRGQSGMVYTSSEGLDEMALTGPVSVWLIADGKVTATEFNPITELGLDPVTPEQLRGGEPELNASIFRDFLDGKPVASRTTALLNAASAIVADGHLIANGSLTDRFRQAYGLAQEAVDSGKAKDLLERWVKLAQSKRA